MQPHLGGPQAMDSPEGYSVQATAAIAAIITFLILFTIFGNVLVIIAVLTSRSLKAPQNLFLVSLAAADILVATLIIPFSLANELMGYWHFRKTWCEIYLALDVLFCTSSIVHLCAISLDRYWSVSQAIEYNSKRTPKRIKGIILIVWMIAAFISLPPLIYKGNKKDSQDGRPQCKLNEEAWYILSSSIGSFFAPCIIMILVYLRIYFIAKHRTRQGSRGKKPKAEKKGTSKKITGLTSETSPQQLGAREPNGHQVPNEDSDQPVTPTLPAHRTSLLSLEEQQELPPSTTNPCQPQPEKKESSGSSPLERSPHCNLKQRNGHPQNSVKGMETLATAKGEVLLVRRVKTLSANPWKRKTHLNREKRFTFVLAVVIGVFVLCWFPFFFLYSLGAICPEVCKVPNSVFQFFFWIGYCNSSLNPVIYTIFNQDFRKAFRKILCRQGTQTAW
ncbi:alpha-2B adrenergic receptor [Gopherus flavomarginatus]|uniref:alpha-2B adrenergic receptor n=1 Tax=Gopherus flavomarginatus TaxID=286002 RepID=UPI0021CBB274|nr:alpha-2B adrenergic receptor [Gopherus flavomarginatus]